MKYLAIKYDFKDLTELTEELNSRAKKDWRIISITEPKEYEDDPSYSYVTVIWEKEEEDFGKC